MKKNYLIHHDSLSSLRHARDYLQAQGLDFEEKNVREDMEARKELIDKRILGVPTFFYR